MVLVLKEGASNQEIEAIDKEIAKKKSAQGFDAKKYNGILSLKEDALKIQQDLRNEWERNID